VPESKLGRIVWTDLTVKEAEKLRDFYAAVADWRFEPVQMGNYADFNMIPRDSSEPAAGVCHARGRNAALPPQWLVYISVADLDHAIRECEIRGGRVIDGPRSMGEQRFCVIQDPVGAVAGLIGP
jgi:hypothetical protein